MKEVHAHRFGILTLGGMVVGLILTFFENDSRYASLFFFSLGSAWWYACHTRSNWGLFGILNRIAKLVIVPIESDPDTAVDRGYICAILCIIFGVLALFCVGSK